MSIIGIDMDGTIANFTSLAIKTTNRLFGTNFTTQDMVEPRIGQFAYDSLTSEQQAAYENPNDIYRDICYPGFFYEIEPFDGAIKAVKEIAKKHEIIFITKPLEWDNCPSEKKRWLDKYFPGIDYKLMLVDSMELKGLVRVDILIEDDPRAIKSLRGTDTTGILVKQPWNADIPIGMHKVESFAEVPEILDEVIKYRHW